MSRKASPAMVGAFVVGALTLGVLGLAYFGSGRFFRDVVPMVAYFSGSVTGLKVGAPVRLKGVEIGTVREVRLNIGANPWTEPETARIPVIVEIDQKMLRSEGARRAVDEKIVESLIAHGLRAQLSTESLVTGVLYVGLDFHPDTPVYLVADPSVHLVEIPTLPTTLEEVQASVSRLVRKLDDVDLKQLVANASETLDTLHRILDQPDMQNLPATLHQLLSNLDGTATRLDGLVASARQSVVPRLGTTLDDASAALRGARGTFDANAPLGYKLEAALSSFTGAARAIQALAEELERNPSSLIRGRYVSKDHGE
jgi:paraquat-inducible protein B